MGTASPIRILLISPFFAPHIGGSQRYMEELYTHIIAKHPHVSVDVLCYNTDGAKTEEVFRGLRIYRIPCWHILWGQFALPSPYSLLSMLWKLSHKKYHIVHTHIRFFDATWWAWMYARWIGAKSIFTEHVATHPTHQSGIVRCIAKIIDKTISKFSIQHYDKILTTNTSAKLFLQNTLSIYLPIDIVYGGVDTTMFHALEQNKRSIPHADIRLSSNTVIISYAGRLIWSKGMLTFFDAIKNIIPNIPPTVIFVFAGIGDQEAILKRDTTEAQLQNRIFFPGPLSSTEVATLLGSTDIFVHPSHHNEGFPNVLLEAGAASCYVIATNNAGTAEIVRDKITGKLITEKDPSELAQELLWAITHTKERKTQGKKLRGSIEKQFEWDHIAEKYYQNHLIK